MIEDLAARQLTAYNESDLDGFCACYHPEVRVLNADEEVLQGIDDFRQRYAALFAHWQFGATVPTRLSCAEHCVDYEHWWRVDPETGERSEGEVLVRYTERDGLIAVVQFFR